MKENFCKSFHGVRREDEVKLYFGTERMIRPSYTFNVCSWGHYSCSSYTTYLRESWASVASVVGLEIGNLLAMLGN